MVLFPSPYGEVGFNQEEMTKQAKALVLVFPSPYGEVGFDHQADLHRRLTGFWQVSVPLRGSWF